MRLMIMRLKLWVITMSNKQSLWMRGLLYAESIGADEATIQLYQHEFDDCCADFDRGVSDYINHAKRVEEVIHE